MARLAASSMLEWKDGLFRRVIGPTGFNKLAAERKIEDIFIASLERRSAQFRPVSDKPGANYAPAVFAKDPEAATAGLTAKQLEAAMERLFKAGKIRVEIKGPQEPPNPLDRCRGSRAGRLSSVPSHASSYALHTALRQIQTACPHTPLYPPPRLKDARAFETPAPSDAGGASKIAKGTQHGLQKLRNARTPETKTFRE